MTPRIRTASIATLGEYECKGPMFSIEWFASRSETRPVERTAYKGLLQRAAFVHAQSSFAEVKRKHPAVTGFRIVDEAGEEVERWFVGDNYR